MTIAGRPPAPGARGGAGMVRRALAALGGRRRPANTSTLIVAAPAARAAWAGWPGSPERLCVPGLPPHITVLYPFISPGAIDAEVEEALELLAGGLSPFSYSLDHLARFPGVLYIAPEPPDPFVKLTESVHARWPQHPPYGGAYETVEPHVTVALGREPADLAQVIQRALPIQATATGLALLCQDGSAGGWVTRRTFPLGG